ncbi:hypothetical protein L596_019060 [Steinernema carpocapsae]|uniref:F-box domain-containing protein n=1 Tax=Steinernema carpocapsae TaxID=34508 RepID=A0A4V6A277_STECR|nr:hypothetical protein L596_019060 [Steinernema carpocapsae]
MAADARRVVPNLPDLVLRKVFAYLNYAQKCRLEVVCKRWLRIINFIFKKEILELHLERVSGSEAFAFQQVPLGRLCVRVPEDDDVDFLSGILRRCRISLSRLTCDLKLLATIDEINCRREVNRKYFSNVHELWLLVSTTREDLYARFESIEMDLFTNISLLTLQLHPNHVKTEQMERVIKSFERYKEIEMNVELQADKEFPITTHLEKLKNRKIKKLKLICTAIDQGALSLTKLYTILAEASIVVENLTLRDWSLTCDAKTRLVRFPMRTLRISSCEITNVDALASALRFTFTNFSFHNPHRKKMARAQTDAQINPYDGPSKLQSH